MKNGASHQDLIPLVAIYHLHSMWRQTLYKSKGEKELGQIIAVKSNRKNYLRVIWFIITDSFSKLSCTPPYYYCTTYLFFLRTFHLVSKPTRQRSTCSEKTLPVILNFCQACRIDIIPSSTDSVNTPLRQPVYKSSRSNKNKD